MSQQRKSDFLRTFSETLRAIRLRRGWSQEDMAEKLGVSPGAVANWETMANGPSRSRVREIAEKLGVSVEFLTGEPVLVMHETPGDYRVDFQLLFPAAPPLVRECLGHLAEFLKLCKDDPVRLGWTVVELKSKFPHDKWKEEPTAQMPPVHGVSLTVNDALQSSADDAAAMARAAVRGPLPSSPTHEPTGDKPKP